MVNQQMQYSDLKLIDFEPIGRRIEVKKGSTILDAARKAGIELIAICGGSGTCGQCKVQIKTDKMDKPGLADYDFFSQEQLSEGWRLACRTVINYPMKVFVPPESLTTKQRLQIESSLDKKTIESIFSIEEIILDEKIWKLSKAEQIHYIKQHKILRYADKELKEEIKKYFSDTKNFYSKKISIVMRNGKPDYFFCEPKSVYGLAVDLGTTKIAAYLIDLLTGRTVANASAMNPQISYGEDVISRILYCIEEPNGSNVMKNLVIETLNDLCFQMYAEIGINPNQVIESVIVGNTAMHHLATELPVKQLGLSPYRPAQTDSLFLNSIDLGLEISPRGKVYLPENIAGYVGGDHVAMIVASKVNKAEDTVIAIDVGTNTEISLVNKGKIYSCSCASGPAFEGAHIKNGMRATDGAIERVIIHGDSVQYQTIGSIIPSGLCGSGILDSVAELKKNKIIDERGRFDPHRKNVRGIGKDQEYVLVSADKAGSNHDIVITRKDVNEILLAKAAVQSGIQVLLKTAGLSIPDIDRIIVAGAFGSYLDLNNAMVIGMFPRLSVNRYSQVGNAAGVGAKLMLVSEKTREQAKYFAKMSEYVELTLCSEFQKIYLASLKFNDFRDLV